MSSVALPRQLAGSWRGVSLPVAVSAIAFIAVFASPMASLARDWWADPDAGHGLLLAPLAVFLAWKAGIHRDARPAPLLGMSALIVAVVFRFVGGLAAELFTMRMSLLLGAAALLVFACGLRQVAHWWLPISLLALSIPLPSMLLGAIALPLQLQASGIGAALLEWRHVPVLLSGNVIHLPGRSLFVTEACSGLRSLTALLSLGVLLGGLWLRSPWNRGMLLAMVLPVAVVINGIRVFLTGFLVYFVNPALGEGVMHYTEGWALFGVAFLVLAGLTAVLGSFERRRREVAA